MGKDTDGNDEGGRTKVDAEANTESQKEDLSEALDNGDEGEGADVESRLEDAGLIERSSRSQESSGLGPSQTAAAHKRSHGAADDLQELKNDLNAVRETIDQTLTDQANTEAHLRKLVAGLEEDAAQSWNSTFGTLDEARATGKKRDLDSWEKKLKSSEFTPSDSEYAEGDEGLLSYVKDQASAITDLNDNINDFTNWMSELQDDLDQERDARNRAKHWAKAEKKEKIKDAKTEFKNDKSDILQQVKDMTDEDIEGTDYDNPRELGQDEIGDARAKKDSKVQDAEEEFISRRDKIEEAFSSAQEDIRDEMRDVKDEKQEMTEERSTRIDELSEAHEEYANAVDSHLAKHSSQYAAIRDQLESVADIVDSHNRKSLDALNSIVQELDVEKAAEETGLSEEVIDDLDTNTTDANIADWGQNAVYEFAVRAATELGKRAKSHIDEMREAHEEYQTVAEELPEEVNSRDFMDYVDINDEHSDLDDAYKSLVDTVADYVSKSIGDSYDSSEEFLREVEAGI